MLERTGCAITIAPYALIPRERCRGNTPLGKQSCRLVLAPNRGLRRNSREGLNRFRRTCGAFGRAQVESQGATRRDFPATTAPQQSAVRPCAERSARPKTKRPTHKYVGRETPCEQGGGQDSIVGPLDGQGNRRSANSCVGIFPTRPPGKAAVAWHSVSRPAFPPGLPGRRSSQAAVANCHRRRSATIWCPRPESNQDLMLTRQLHDLHATGARGNTIEL